MLISNGKCISYKAQSIEPTMWTDFKGNFYYKVIVRQYIHFNPINIPIPIGEYYYGSIYAPYKQLDLKIVTIQSDTYMQQHSFTIKDYNVENHFDKVKEQISNSDIFKLYESELVKRYLDEIKEKYNVVLDRNSVDYYTQLCFEVKK